jgi:hypothetical protein
MDQTRVSLLAAILLVIAGVISLVSGSAVVGVLFVAAGVLFLGASRRRGGV